MVTFQKAPVTTWPDFYRQRVNNKSYELFFEKRYYPLIHTALELKPYSILEEGMGIGTISKLLIAQTPVIDCFGFGQDPEMVKLARENVPTAIVWEDDIMRPRTVKRTDLIITHGVLEHFYDHEIWDIMRRYKLIGAPQLHYVPTDKYLSPSFGDERLLSPMKWLKLVKPKDYILFNDDHDLLLIN